MKKNIIGLIAAAALIGCSSQKEPDTAKSADTVYIEKAAAIPEIHSKKNKQSAPAHEKKDVLDKANDGLDKANSTATKTGQVLDKAAEFKQKTDDILSR